MPLKLQHKYRKKSKGNASIECIKIEENCKLECIKSEKNINRKPRAKKTIGEVNSILFQMMCKTI
jgi:hypothetical protein